MRGDPPSAPNWDNIIREANKHLVGPALHRALAKRKRPVAIPDDAEAYLRLQYDLNCERNARLKTQCLEAVAALNEAGIEPILLKGTAILWTAPEDAMGLRMISDLDFLVPPEQLPQAMEALLSLGYKANFKAGDHAHAKLYRTRDVGTVDLHHRPPGPAHLYQGHPTSAAEIVDVAGHRARIPPVTDRMIHLIAHDMINDRHFLRGSIDLRHLLDLRDLIKTGAVDWDALHSRFRLRVLPWAFKLCLVNLRELLRVDIEDAAACGLLSRVLYGRQIFLERNPWCRRIEPVWTIFRLYRRIQGKISP